MLELVVPGLTERSDVRRQCESSVEDNSEVALALDDRDGGRQHRNVVDVNVLQLLAGAEPRDLRLGRVQPQSYWLSCTH